jgi:hypothetical protein
MELFRQLPVTFAAQIGKTPVIPMYIIFYLRKANEFVAFGGVLLYIT